MGRIEFAGDVFEESISEDGKLKWTCNKTTDGFKVVMNFTIDKNRHNQATKAIENFIINTLSK